MRPLFVQLETRQHIVQIDNQHLLLQYVGHVTNPTTIAGYYSTQYYSLVADPSVVHTAKIRGVDDGLVIFSKCRTVQHCTPAGSTLYTDWLNITVIAKTN